ncbi:MAG: hypothetical protein FWE37_01345 [Spirochaetaceae bacterium]|nr:hypothetical protein [Spirochaetaceae bacterium]
MENKNLEQEYLLEGAAELVEEPQALLQITVSATAVMYKANETTVEFAVNSPSKLTVCYFIFNPEDVNFTRFKLSQAGAFKQAFTSGHHHIAVEAEDEDGRTATKTFTLKVR